MIAGLPISLGGSSQHAKYNLMQAARVRFEDEDLLLLFFINTFYHVCAM